MADLTKLDWVNMYRPVFINHLSMTATFVGNLHFLSQDKKGQLLSRLGSREQAVCDWLQTLEKQQHDDGIYADVLQALDASEQHHIKEMLHNGQTASGENQIRNKCLIRIFTPELVKINPVEMLPYLDCLSDEEQDEIKICAEQQVEQRSVMKMLSYLVLKGEEMYGQLLNALDKTKFQNLAKDLEAMVESESSVGQPTGNDKESARNDNECALSNDNNHVENDVEDVKIADQLNDMAVTTEEHLSRSTEPLNIDTKQEVAGMAVEWNPHMKKTTGDRPSRKDIPTPRKELKLRSYQMELAAPALPGPDGGKNTIIVAPTGSGKTVVAVKVVQEFLEHDDSTGATNTVAKARPKKVVFLVNQVALVEQQSKLLESYLGSEYVSGLSGDTAHGPLKQILDEKSVLVMTAQILVNALRDHNVELSDIGLLILDECHNCQKGTPYNKIMAGIRDMKLKNENPRPQILGMTASLDIAQSKNQYQAETKILQFCANLDAEVISTVHSKECLEELRANQNIPTEDIVEVAGRVEDRFAEEINLIMEIIEKEIQNTGEKGWVRLQKTNDPQLKIPSSRGTQTYEQWVVHMQNSVAVGIPPEDKAVKRILVVCTDHLKVYNDCLYINRDIRTKDALSQLDTFMTDLWNTKKAGFDATDHFLVKLFKDKKKSLLTISEDPASRNPVLERLGTVLKNAFTPTREVQEKRGILFAKTRASTDALLKWIKDTDDLEFLNPGRLIGSGGAEGMTQHQQVDLLELFRDGDHKLIVATSVAQEGLDIAQCNVVVRYNYISSVVARVQARGRNRAKGGQFFLVVDEQLKLKDKDLMNRIREKMMLAATDTIQKRLIDEKDVFMEQIIKLQKDDRLDRDLKRRNEVTKRNKQIKSNVKLTCKKCGELACYSSEVRSVKEAHHIVIADEFADRYELKDCPRFPMLVDDMHLQKTIICAKCKSEWGTQALYRGMTLPLLKIAGFVVEYSNGKQQKTKKWKDVLFKVKPITTEDLQKVVNVDSTEEEEEEEGGKTDATQE